MQRPPHSFRPWLGAVVALVLASASPAEEPRGNSPPTSRLDVAIVSRVMDDWHQAASVADGARYFGHFAPDGVFLGTDDSERWTVEQFRAYAEPYFSKGQGWTYLARDRHVMVSADRSMAWLDEKLDNEAYGRLRGTGVLRRTDGRWRIVHYSMSFPIPNGTTREVVALVKGGKAPSAP